MTDKDDKDKTLAWGLKFSQNLDKLLKENHMSEEGPNFLIKSLFMMTHMKFQVQTIEGLILSHIDDAQMQRVCRELSILVMQESGKKIKHMRTHDK